MGSENLAEAWDVVAETGAVFIETGEEVLLGFGRELVLPSIGDGNPAFLTELKNIEDVRMVTENSIVRGIVVESVSR